MLIAGHKSHTEWDDERIINLCAYMLTSGHWYFDNDPTFLREADPNLLREYFSIAFTGPEAFSVSLRAPLKLHGDQ